MSIKTDTQTIFYTVPPGYVAILRGFRYQFLDMLTSDEPGEVLSTIKVDNIVQPDYNGMDFGYFMKNRCPCYILAYENQAITLQLTAALEIEPGAIVDLRVNCELYGNVLLSRGLPLNYEPGNLKDSEIIRNLAPTFQR